MNNSGEHIHFASHIGFAALLFSFSEHHRRYTCDDLQKYIVIPYRLRQCKIYFNDHGDAVGLVTWAWLSDYSLEKIISESFYDLHISEWNEGRNLYIMDLIAPFGDFEHIVNDLFHQFRAAEYCYSVRRLDNISIRKVTKWRRGYIQRMCRSGK